MLGHMKLTQTLGKYIIPHHSIIKHMNDKIKINILQRCRFYLYMFMADVYKMKWQIQVLPSVRECTNTYSGAMILPRK